MNFPDLPSLKPKLFMIITILDLGSIYIREIDTTGGHGKNGHTWYLRTQKEGTAGKTKYPGQLP